MTFSIYLDDQLANRLNRRASEIGKARNALIREALEDWLVRNQSAQWPESITGFKGVRGAPRFEDARKELKLPRDRFNLRKG